MATYQYDLMAVEDAYVTKAAPGVNNHNVAAASLITDSLYSDAASRYWVQFGSVPEAYHKYRLTAAAVMAYVTSKAATDAFCQFHVRNILSKLDLDSVLWATYPSGAIDVGTLSVPSMTSEVYNGGDDANYFLRTLNGTVLIDLSATFGNSATVGIQGVAGANKPYARLTFIDPTNTIAQTPASGFVNESEAVTLAWQLVTNAYGGASAFTQASAVISWRNGSGGTVYTINVSGSATSKSIAAGTFPSTADLQWKVAVTLTDATVLTSDWATLTTIDSACSCSLVSPVSTFVDGDAINRFSWEHEIETGSAQKAYDLQYSTDGGGTWSNIATAAASANEYHDVAAGTLPAGTLLWRVRTYNTDNVAGSYSTAATVVVQAAPAAPSITSVTASPRPVITWQAVGQQAYQIQAGSYDSGTVYGTAKTHKVPLYLPDGATTLRLRVLNSFGLWSPWAEVTPTITHSSVATVTAAATQSNGEVMLSWAGAHSIYYIYRDDALIAKTAATQYIDRLANGAHSYTVRGATGDAYDLSAAVQITVVCNDVILAAADSGNWIVLYGSNDDPVISVSIARQITYQHYVGRRLPVADVAEYEDESYAFDASVLSLETLAALRALLGAVVCVKTPHGECYIGILESVPHSTGWASSDMSVAIRAIDYQEVVIYDV